MLYWEPCKTYELLFLEFSIPYFRLQLIWGTWNHRWGGDHYCALNTHPVCERHQPRHLRLPGDWDVVPALEEGTVQQWEQAGEKEFWCNLARLKYGNLPRLWDCKRGSTWEVLTEEVTFGLYVQMASRERPMFVGACLGSNSSPVSYWPGGLGQVTPCAQA